MREIGTKKIRLAYNEFTYKKTKDTYKLGFFSIAKLQIKTQDIERFAYMVNALRKKNVVVSRFALNKQV